MHKKYFVDAFIVISILLLIILLAVKTYINDDQEKYVYITTPSKSYYYKLSEDRNLKIDGKIGNTNIEIKNNSVRFTSSPCKNKLCLYEKEINNINQTIICLPNQVSIVIKGKENEVDSVAY